MMWEHFSENKYNSVSTFETSVSTFETTEKQKKYNRNGIFTDFHPIKQFQKYAVLKQTQRVLDIFAWEFH